MNRFIFIMLFALNIEAHGQECQSAEACASTIKCNDNNSCLRAAVAEILKSSSKDLEKQPDSKTSFVMKACRQDQPLDKCRQEAAVQVCKAHGGSNCVVKAVQNKVVPNKPVATRTVQRLGGMIVMKRN